MNKDSAAVQFVSAHSLARWTIIFLGINIGLDVIAVISDFLEIGLLSKAMTDQGITDAEAAANDTRQGIIGILQLLVYFVTVVLFLMWIYRAYKNLPALGANNLKYSPRWAVGGFFVPFLNLVRPFQVVKEIWKASSPDTDGSDGASWQHTPASPVIGWWWAVWLVSGFVGQIVLRVSLRAETIDALMLTSQITLFSEILDAIAALLAIAVVRGIDKRQEEKFARLTTVSAPP